MPANAAITIRNTTMTTASEAQRRSMRAACSALPSCGGIVAISARVLSWHRPARQEHEIVEGQPDRDDDGGGDAGEHDRAARARRDDAVHRVVRRGVGA